ncbi:uncharacterized protein METZ01_LOCUS442785, partial [marine metagenome]
NQTAGGGEPQPETGVVEGILVGKPENNETEVIVALDVRRDGETTASEILVPSNLVEAVGHLVVPNRVKVEWEQVEGENHPTATAVQNLRPEGNEGTVTGKVVDKLENTWIEIKPEEGPLRRYVPRWIGGNTGGLDQVAGNLIHEAEIGSDVRATWVYDERIRLVTLEKPGGNINRIPNAVYNSAETEAGVAVTIDLLANDSDPDGDELDKDSVEISGGSNKGTVVYNGDGTATYTPNEGVAETTDTFNYTVNDEHGATS